MKTEKIKQQLIQQSSKASYNTIIAALPESGNSPKPFKLVLSSKVKDQDGTANAALATELSDFFISPRLNPKSTLVEIINGDIKALLAYDRETPLSDLIKLYFVDTLPQKLRALFAENELATMPIDSLPVDGAQTTLITPKQKADLDALGIPFETPCRQLPVALSVASAFSLVMPLMCKTAKITSIIAILASIITFSVIGLYYLRQLPTLPDAIRIENHVPAKQLLIQALTLGVTLLCGIASFQDSLQESNADRS